MNERIRKIRKYFKLSQDEFGSKLGVTNAAISRIENGDRSVTDQLFISICREFNINENWLRTGDGEMFIEFPEEDEYFRAATEISKSNDELAMQVVIEYWKMDPEGKKLLKDFILNISKHIKKEE
jgi:transcriptional regulator with XRE-family HTH domain